MFIPQGFAHGFSVLGETALIQYKCDNFYAPGSEGGVSLNDPSLGIEWGIPEALITVSDKDRKFPFLEDFESPFSL